MVATDANATPRQQLEALNNKARAVQLIANNADTLWRKSGASSKLEYLKSLVAELPPVMQKYREIYASLSDKQQKQGNIQYKLTGTATDRLPSDYELEQIFAAVSALEEAEFSKLRKVEPPKVEPPRVEPPKVEPPQEAKVNMSEREWSDHFKELKRQRDKKFAEQMRKNREDPAIKALYEEEQARRERYYKVYNRPGYIKRAIIASQSTIAANATAKQRKAAAFKAMRLEGVVDVRMLEDFWASYNYVGYIAGDP